jgi:hypothetical protein
MEKYMNVPGFSLPLLVEDLIRTYYWRSIYRKEVVLHITNPDNRRLKTLEALIDCPWEHNRSYGYPWRLLYHYIHNVFIPFGNWTKYQHTLNKRAERIINITEIGLTQFPINPEIDPKNNKILAEYYKF